MRTIQTRGTVTEDRKLTIELPSDVSPGNHQVVIVIDDEPNIDLAIIAERGGAFDWHDIAATLAGAVPVLAAVGAQP